MSATPLTATVYVGNTTETHEAAIDALQKLLCPHRSSGAHACRCSICSEISDQRSPHVTWLRPHESYVLEDLAPIFLVMQYALDTHQRHALVIPHAEKLSLACANKLLKSIEEPPAGYFFLLLTTDYTALLPTIQSRTVVVYQGSSNDRPQSELFQFFTDPDKCNDPVAFDAFLKTQTIEPTHARQLVHDLVFYAQWPTYERSPELNAALEHAQRHFPFPGGGAQYVRWLFMTLHHLRHRKDHV